MTSVKGFTFRGIAMRRSISDLGHSRPNWAVRVMSGLAPLVRLGTRPKSAGSAQNHDQDNQSPAPSAIETADCQNQTPWSPATMATSETSKPIPQKTVTDQKSAENSGTGFARSATDRTSVGMACSLFLPCNYRDSCMKRSRFPILAVSARPLPG